MQRIAIPDHFGFKDFEIYNFDKALELFDWDIENDLVVIDFSDCFHANYQAIALIVPYIWYLRKNGCRLEFIYDKNNEGASDIWRKMGARGWSQVLTKDDQNFVGNHYKPLIALRSTVDFKKALSAVEKYTEGFDIEYEKTLRYVISELLYNTLEHGKSFYQFKSETLRIPSIIQFTWYQQRNELQFIVADTGIGIKEHLEQAYPGQENHASAIKKALSYKVSGTFGTNDPYKNKDNAGVGLYISSNIVRKLQAEMHIVSENGLVHISPRDITTKTLKKNWKGTFVLVTIRLESDSVLNLHQLMSELRETAEKELKLGLESEEKGEHYVGIQNFFGKFAENKEEAISYRSSYLLDAVHSGKVIKLDFQGVVAAPHSFLSALIATPIQIYGMEAYKKIKVVNAEPEIRETIDYILDDNT